MSITSSREIVQEQLLPLHLEKVPPYFLALSPGLLAPAHLLELPLDLEVDEGGRMAGQ